MIKIIEPTKQTELDIYFRCRWRILRAPWNQPAGSEQDEFESESIHACAIDEFGNALGVGRLHMLSDNFGQLRYMGVEDSSRNQGIGRKLLNFLEAKALQLKIAELELHARENAVSFYQKYGYQNIGESYILWDEIQHYRMCKKLK